MPFQYVYKAKNIFIKVYVIFFILCKIAKKQKKHSSFLKFL